jgi:hypothetical protein
MEILRKNQKQILEIKHTVTIINVFDGLIKQLDRTEKRTSGLNDRLIESKLSKLKM